MSLTDPNSGLPTLPPTDKSLPLVAWASFIVGFWPVSIVIAYLERDKAPLFRTHYQYLIRTFWIGSLYLAVSLVLLIVLVGFVLLFAVTIWFYARCARAVIALLRNEPIAVPLTWFV